MATKVKKAPAPKPRKLTKPAVDKQHLIDTLDKIASKIDVHERAVRLLITRVAVLADKEAELRDKIAALEAEAERKKNRWFVR